MENKTNNADLPFMTAKFYLKSLYGISIDDADFIELGMMAQREYNTYNLEYYKFDSKLDDTYCITIPSDNVRGIESVSIVNDSDPIEKLTLYNSNLDKRQTTGVYVNYSILDDSTIKINNKNAINSFIRIIFNSEILDNENLPMLNMKQAKAIAARVAFFETQKRAYLGDPAASNFLQYIKQESGRLCLAASIPQNLSDNDLDKIADTMTSFNRKKYGVPLKFTR